MFMSDLKLAAVAIEEIDLLRFAYEGVRIQPRLVKKKKMYPSNNPLQSHTACLNAVTFSSALLTQ